MNKTWMKVLFGAGAALLLASAHACGSDNPVVTTGDAGTDGGADAGRDGGTTPDCFTGTPTTNDQLQNACTPDTTVKVLKTSSIPRGKSTLPPLP